MSNTRIGALLNLIIAVVFGISATKDGFEWLILSSGVFAFLAGMDWAFWLAKKMAEEYRGKE